MRRRMDGSDRIYGEKNLKENEVNLLHSRGKFGIMGEVNSREERTTIKRNSRTRLNSEIRYPEVRVIGSSGEQLGIMSSREAQLLAKEQGVDLVEIAANANPPVVKIIDWGKYQ